MLCAYPDVEIAAAIRFPCVEVIGAQTLERGALVLFSAASQFAA